MSWLAVREQVTRVAQLGRNSAHGAYSGRATMHNRHSEAGCLAAHVSLWAVAGLLLLVRSRSQAADAVESTSPADLTGLSLEELATTKIVSVYGASKHEQAE